MVRTIGDHPIHRTSVLPRRLALSSNQAVLRQCRSATRRTIPSGPQARLLQEADQPVLCRQPSAEVTGSATATSCQNFSGRCVPGIRRGLTDSPLAEYRQCHTFHRPGFNVALYHDLPITLQELLQTSCGMARYSPQVAAGERLTLPLAATSIASEKQPKNARFPKGGNRRQNGPDIDLDRGPRRPLHVHPRLATLPALRPRRGSMISAGRQSEPPPTGHRLRAADRMVILLAAIGLLLSMGCAAAVYHPA